MRPVLQYVSWGVGLWLNLLVVAALVRRGYRDYKWALVYAVALLLATISEITAATVLRSELQHKVYWTNEVILDLLVFCLVIAFIDRAAQDAHRPVARRLLIAVAALIVLVTVYTHRDLTLNRRMTLVSRDLNICAVVLDVLLWSLLIAVRRPNRQLLLLSGGLGMQLTGVIMGATLRNLSRNAAIPGTLLEVTTGLLGLYVWWQAFRREPVTQDRVRENPTAASG